MILQRWRFLLNIFFALLITINVMPAHGSKLTDNMVKIKAAKDKILNGYDKYLRPTMEGTNTTVVHTELIPIQIMSLDEDNGLFTLDSFFFMTWQDPRLNWSSSEVNYDGYLQLPADLLWLPDISVHNSHSQSINPTQNVLAVVTSGGRVFWVPPLLTESYCPELMESTYPYGVVECVLILGSWVHDGFSIDYQAHDSVYLYEFHNTNLKWELLADKARMVRNVTLYEEENEMYISLQVFFPVRRRPLAEIEVTRSPCILVMLITLSVFFLPPNSTKKIHLLGIMFIILTVLLVYVSWSTKYGIRVLFAVTFLQSTLYIVAVTFLLQVLVIFNLCKLSGPMRPPPAAMQLLSGPFGKYVCLQWPLDSHGNLPLDRLQLQEDDSPSIKDSPSPNEDWLLFAAGLDRLFFVLISIAMIAIHHL